MNIQITTIKSKSIALLNLINKHPQAKFIYAGILALPAIILWGYGSGAMALMIS